MKRRQAVRTKIVILAIGAISFLLLEIAYSLALRRYDPGLPSFRLRGPITIAIVAFTGISRETSTATGPFPPR